MNHPVIISSGVHISISVTYFIFYKVNNFRDSSSIHSYSFAYLDDVGCQSHLFVQQYLSIKAFDLKVKEYLMKQEGIVFCMMLNDLFLVRWVNVIRDPVELIEGALVIDPCIEHGPEDVSIHVLNIIGELAQDVMKEIRAEITSNALSIAVVFSDLVMG
jgi:hypothetical protein